MKKLMHDIARGKDLAVNLLRFRDLAGPLYNEYAALELTFNAYTMLQEIVEEKPELAGQEGEAVAELLSLLDAVSRDTPDREALIARAKKLRDEITGRMDLFTAYTDRLIVYEYVMNRMELSFEPEEKLDGHLADFDETYFMQSILSWLYADKDQSVIRDKLRLVIGQVPVRITKTKLFERITETFTLYKGGDRASLDDFIYMLRTSAMLHDPPFYTGARAVEEALRELEGADFGSVTKERYEELAAVLENGARLIHDLTDFYYTMQRVVNDIYAFCLSVPFGGAGGKSKLISACQSIWRCLARRKYMDTMLVPLEGRIESYEEKTSYLEAALVEVKSSYPDEIDRSGMSSFFEDFTVVVNLLSDSLFIDLEKVNAGETADVSYVRQKTDAFIAELAERMAGLSRPVKRAVTAAVLEKLPMPFQKPEDVEDYIRANLFGCGDKAEKITVISILSDLMYEDIEG